MSIKNKIENTQYDFHIERLCERYVWETDRNKFINEIGEKQFHKELFNPLPKLVWRVDEKEELLSYLRVEDGAE